MLETATLVRLNRDHPEAMAENKERTVSFAEDMHLVLGDLLAKRYASAAGAQGEEDAS